MGRKHQKNAGKKSAKQGRSPQRKTSIPPAPTQKSPSPGRHGGNTSQNGTTPSTVPSPANPTLPSSSEDEQEKPSLLHSLAHQWRKGVVALLQALGIAAILAVVGLNGWTFNAPLFTFFVQYPFPSLLLGGVLIIITLAAHLILILSTSSGKGKNKWWETVRPFLFNGVLIFCLIFSFFQVGMDVFRPTWCPSFFCPVPQSVNNDLEVSLVSIQSDWYMIDGNLADYSLQKLPESIPAVQLDEVPAALPYRVIFHIYNPIQGPYRLLIEQVVLVVKQVFPMPFPLRVWDRGSGNYQENPYKVVYQGQPATTSISAAPIPITKQTLLPSNSSDDLDIQVLATLPAYLQFQLQIVYRIANSPAQRLYVYPTPFKVVFSTQQNWHPFTLRDGHFTPISSSSGSN